MEGRGPSLICSLDQIICCDPLIDELGLVPSVAPDALPLEFAPDSTPSAALYDSAAFWVGEHKLAIALDAAKEMYSAALRMLKELRKENGNDERVLMATQAVVVVNAEHYTAWNTRKRVLLRSPTPAKCAPLELQLSALALSVHPKSEATWAHRRWVLRSLLQIATCPQEDVLQAESALAQRCAELRPMNYRAWSHRSWAARWMSTEQLRAELSASRPWVEQHVTDNCGLHYRRRLLLLLLQRTTQNEDLPAADELRGSLVSEEQSWLTPIMDYYQGREALWLHRRFLAQLSLPLAGLADRSTTSGCIAEDYGASSQPPEDEHLNGQRGNAQWPLPLWKSEEQFSKGGIEGAMGLAPGRCRLCASEDAVVTEVKEKVRRSSHNKDIASSAQLMLAGRHMMWTRHLLHVLPEKGWQPFSALNASLG